MSFFYLFNTVVYLGFTQPIVFSVLPDGDRFEAPILLLLLGALFKLGYKLGCCG